MSQNQPSRSQAPESHGKLRNTVGDPDVIRDYLAVSKDSYTQKVAVVKRFQF